MECIVTFIPPNILGLEVEPLESAQARANRIYQGDMSMEATFRERLSGHIPQEIKPPDVRQRVEVVLFNRVHLPYRPRISTLSI